MTEPVKWARFTGVQRDPSRSCVFGVSLDAWIVQGSPLRRGPFASWGIPKFRAAEGSSILYTHLVVMFAAVYI